MSIYSLHKKGILGLLLLVCSFSVIADGIKSKRETPFQAVSQSEFNEKQFYQAMVAEFYHQANQPKLTLKYYLPIALESNDPRLLKRVTEIAAATAQLKKALIAAKHWVDLSPESLDAQQYYALLLLRDGQLKKSATQLNMIRHLVDQGSDENSEDFVVSRGLKFIGALLVIESHHDKAYQVFNYYLKQLKETALYQEQKQLILASLGMKAKKYEVVVEALGQIEINKSEYFSSAVLMKMNALKKLGRIEEAAIQLQKLVDTNKASDSLRLELTRLLISMGKHAAAERELDKLVRKHPDNHDLLKALIAVNIVQKEWGKSKANNAILGKNKSYANEFNYFSGEILEGEGDLNAALTYFKRVKKGVFLKKSFSKRARLLAQIESMEHSRQWLHSQQNKPLAFNDKVFWLKLEADMISDKRLLHVIGLSQNTARKNIDSAIGLYDEVIALSPQKIVNRYYRGLLFERAHQLDRAEIDFKYVVKHGKKKAEALNALGFLLINDTDRLGEAKRYIEAAYKLKPNDAVIMDSLGWVYYQMGEIEKSEAFLRKAFQRSQAPNVAVHFIKVLTKKEKYQEASRVFDEINNLYPDNPLLKRLRRD